MTIPWTPTVQLIQDNIDVVAARDTNRPLSQLALRTQYLYERLQDINAGEALIASAVGVSADTVAGTPVYFDAATNTFKPALAVLDQTEGNYGYASSRAEVRGVVLAKHTATSADILLSGRSRGELNGIDWASLIDEGDLQAGTYYLSSVNPGKLTRARSVLSVYVGILDSSGTLIFTPDINGNLRNHIHYRFELEAVLGTTLADPGWVPVAQFVPSGIPIPPGATYGYNLSQNPELAAQFPPNPLSSHYLEFVGRGVHQDAYILDQYGLWWVNAAVTPAAMATDANFPALPKYYTLWVSKLQADTASVTSLQPSANATVVPVRFRTAGGLAATKGDLVASVEQVGVVTSTADLAGTAIKTVNGAQITLGPAVSTLVAGENISLSSTANGPSGHAGVVTISAGTGGTSLGQPSLVALNNAVEDFYGVLPTLTLPRSRASSIIVRVNVPTNFSATRQLRLTLDVIGTTTQAGVSLGVGYASLKLGQSVPTTFTTLANLVFNIEDNKLARVTSGPVAVSAGDTVYFQVTQPSTALTFGLPLVRLQYEISES